MGIDIRIPIGALFMLVGGLLVLAGATTAPEPVAGLSSTLVDAGWGVFMALFGATMLGLSARARAGQGG